MSVEAGGEISQAPIRLVIEIRKRQPLALLHATILLCLMVMLAALVSGCRLWTSR